MFYTNDMQGGVENYLAQNDSNNEYKWMFQDTLPYMVFPLRYIGCFGRGHESPDDWPCIAESGLAFTRFV